MIGDFLAFPALTDADLASAVVDVDGGRNVAPQGPCGGVRICHEYEKPVRHFNEKSLSSTRYRGARGIIASTLAEAPSSAMVR